MSFIMIDGQTGVTKMVTRSTGPRHQGRQAQGLPVSLPGNGIRVLGPVQTRRCPTSWLTGCARSAMARCSTTAMTRSPHFAPSIPMGGCTRPSTCNGSSGCRADRHSDQGRHQPQIGERLTCEIEGELITHSALIGAVVVGLADDHCRETVAGPSAAGRPDGNRAVTAYSGRHVRDPQAGCRSRTGGASSVRIPGRRSARSLGSRSDSYGSTGSTMLRPSHPTGAHADA